MATSIPPPAMPLLKQTRPSRFIEGSECTSLDLLDAPSASILHLLDVLSQMDEFERQKRHHRSSASSVESFASTTNSVKTNNSTMDAHMEGLMLGAKEGRRVVSFGSTASSKSGHSSMERRKRSWSGGVRDEFRVRSDSRLEGELSSVENVVRSWASRLRALTAGKGSRSGETYDGP